MMDASRVLFALTGDRRLCLLIIAAVALGTSATPKSVGRHRLRPTQGCGPARVTAGAGCLGIGGYTAATAKNEAGCTGGAGCRSIRLPSGLTTGRQLAATEAQVGRTALTTEAQLERSATVETSVGSRLATAEMRATAAASERAAFEGARATRAVQVAQQQASGLQVLVESQGKVAFEQVGKAALDGEANLRKIPTLVARYPQIANRLGDKKFLIEFAKREPNFVRDVGKEIYFTSHADWVAFGGERGLVGLSVQHSAAFRAEALEAASQRFTNTLVRLAKQPPSGALIENTSDGVLLTVNNGRISMQITTTHFTFLIKALPLTTVASAGAMISLATLGADGMVHVSDSKAANLDEALSNASVRKDLAQRLLGQCLGLDLTGATAEVLRSSTLDFQRQRGLSESGDLDDSTFTLLSTCAAP